MPMADQQRGPFRVDGLNGATANSITCRTCGCLNFSSDDECERCRNARVGDSAAAAPAVRHPFLPTSRPTNGTANGSSSRPSSTAPSPRGPSPRPTSSTSSISKDTRISPDAREDPNNLRRGSGNGHSGRGAENSRTSDSRRPGPPPATSSADRTAKKEASVAPAKVIQPGSSIRAFMQPTLSAAVPVGKAPASSSATTASAEANGSTLSAVGDKRARRVASTANDKAAVVIDLISSDEESENHQKRAAKRARQAARQRESISRLALRRVEPEEEQDGAIPRTLSPDREVEDLILEPIKGRSFDCVDFNPDDFPTAIEMAQAMRVRHGVSSSNSTASSALSTPTAAASSVAPPLAARETVSTTAPTTARVAPHTTVPQVMSAPASASNSVSLLVPPSAQATSPAAVPATAPTATTTIYRTPLATSTTPAAYSTGPPAHAVSSGVAKPPSVIDPTTAANPGSIATTLPPKVSPPPSTTAHAANEASVSTASVQSVSSSAPPTPVARTPASQRPIIVDDSEDDSEEGTCMSGKIPLFQSRRFQSVVFSARDFLTANDGLNLARRSSTMTSQPVSPEGKTTGPTSLTSPAHSQVSTMSSATTTKEVRGQALPGSPTSDEIKTLQPRRKAGGTNGTSTVSTSDPMQQTTIKMEHPATLVRIIKPTLGHISTDFVHFMRECIEDDDRDDDDDEALAREKLMEIVDLTNLTDESADEDDEDDYFELLETTASPELQRPTSANGPALAESSSVNLDHAVLSKGGDGAIVENGQPQTGPVVVKRTRAPRPKEMCMLCEEKAWIRALVNCPDCKKYYHKRCARDYGDDSVCWNCDADGMIDDSELTEDHTNQVVGIFGALRQSSDSEPGEDDELDGNADVANPEPSLSLHTVSTRSTRRWKEFLEVSTADMEQSFHAITNQITQELQDEATKSKYSKGFARREDLEKGMAQVVDHYAELQEREERLQREERTRAPPLETADAGGVEGTEGLPAADFVSTGGTAAQLPPAETVGSVDPLPPSAPPVDPNGPFPG